jgi:hypothetical protein
MAKVVYTQHARDVMQERNIRKAWIERVLKKPLLIEPDRLDDALEHRLGRIKGYGNRVLRVIVNRNVAPEKVITVYFDRTMKGKL